MEGESNFEEFLNTTNLHFDNNDLLRQAFIHRSYINENPGETLGHNERLEYLGDAVLELVVTEHIFGLYPDKPEGELTAIRAALVNTHMLSSIGHDLGFNDYLLLSKGEANSVGRARSYILANTFEALVGALYLDGGYAKAQEFIARVLLPKAQEIVDKKLWQDAKSRFQELSQEKRGVTPTYKVLNEDGPDHAKVFTVGLFIADEDIAEGTGASKQEAEQNAAHEGLAKMGWE
ncbi:ribonuclease III [bacterium]|nr:ribonuclease III [bacterium]|tara:strand:+ start:2038 stop:2739 length:702 start_codon:yes stop_codon:yes gene_type:complete